MSEDNSIRMSEEEEHRPIRTRLDSHFDVSTTYNGSTLISRNEMQRQRKAREDKRTDPFLVVELYHTQEMEPIPKKECRCYVSSVNSVSEMNEVSRNIAEIERKEHGGDAVPFYTKPPTTNGDRFRRHLDDAWKLDFQIEIDSSICSIKNYEVVYECCKEQIKLHSSSSSPIPCIRFDLIHNDGITTTSTTDLKIRVTCFDENGRNRSDEPVETLYPVKFHNEHVKKTPSEHQASSAISTQVKAKLEANLPYIQSNIHELQKILKILYDDGLLDETLYQTLSLSQHEPVFELISVVLTQESGIQKLILALEKTQDESNVKIAKLLRGIIQP